MSATYGPISPKEFAYYDHDSWCWKTSPVTDPKDSVTYSATWPRTGMTRAGRASVPVMLEHRTSASGSSFSRHTVHVRPLLPTPTARDWKDGYPCPNVPENSLLGRVIWRSGPDWDVYRPALDHWANLTRPAPPRDVNGRINPEFSEWLMGMPAGWVTDLGLPRTAQLQVIGNAVNSVQAELALRRLLLEG